MQHLSWPAESHTTCVENLPLQELLVLQPGIEPTSNPAGTSASLEAARHRLQNLTDEYLNEPHAAAQDPQPPPPEDDTWCPSDPPPLSESLPPLQGDSPAYAAAKAAAETEERVSPFEYARLNHTEPLAAWVCSHGGYINTALEIGMSPTLGCRCIPSELLIGAPGWLNRLSVPNSAIPF